MTEAITTDRPTAFRCPDCDEWFAVRVWHCAECGHHWPAHRDTCWNCHADRKGQPLDENGDAE